MATQASANGSHLQESSVPPQDLLVGTRISEANDYALDQQSQSRQEASQELDDEPPRSLLYETPHQSRLVGPDHPHRGSSNDADGPFEAAQSGSNSPSGTPTTMMSHRYDERKDPERDLESSSTPQPSHPRNHTHATHPSTEAFFSPPSTNVEEQLQRTSSMRGRSTRKDVRPSQTPIASTSQDTFRSNSASPPPDLLESGSTSSELESLHLGNRKSRKRTGKQSRHQAGSRDKAAKQPLLPPPVTSGSPQSPTTQAGPSRAHQGNPYEHLRSYDDESSLQRPDAIDNVNQVAYRKGKRGHRNHRKFQSRKSQIDVAIQEDGDELALDGKPASETDRKTRRKRSRTHDSQAWIKSAGKNLTDKEKAMWMWVNVVDLDGYLQEVSSYHAGVPF